MTAGELVTLPVPQVLADLAAYEAAHPHPAGIGPSDIGECPRRVFYRVTGTPQDREEAAILRATAWLGAAVHQAIAEARKHAHPTWLVEQPVTVPGMERPGTCDAYMDDLRNVDDVKTKSGRGFDAILGRGKAYDSDVEQTELYALGLEDAGHEVATCSVTYVDRNGYQREGEHGVFVDSWSYDRKRALRAVGRLNALQDAVDDGVVPARAGGGPGTGRPCDSCPWIKTCWNLDKVPEGYTAQSAFLAPAEVAEAAAQLHALRQEASEIDKAQDYLKLQLQGHGGAVFTDHEGIQRRVSYSKGSSTGGALAQKEAAKLLEQAGLPVPRLGTSPRLTLPAVK